MDEEFCKDASGNWTAPLPFRPGRQRLPSNRSQAQKRANLLVTNLKTNPTKKQHFLEFMKEILDKGHAQKTPPLKDSDECWYLPIFGVYHPKKPTQLRGVFDSSAVSLNQVLMSGPDLTNSLLDVPLRFRREPIAIIADIQKMFYSFYVKEEHRNLLRFFWYQDNDPDQQLVEYRMCVHVFGNSPSPAVATYRLRKTVENCDKHGVKDFVEKNFYVDDALASECTNDRPVELVKRTQDVLQSEGHLRLNKIASNCKEVLSAFSEEDFAKELKTVDFMEESLPLQHSLGLAWDLNTGTFTFQLCDSQTDKHYTRRRLLPLINNIFDPIGFLAPSTIRGKILLRDLSLGGVDWDERLPLQRQHEWNSWKLSLDAVEDIHIQRAYTPLSVTAAVERQLHVYSDASEKTIASVAYRSRNLSQRLHKLVWNRRASY